MLLPEREGDGMSESNGRAAVLPRGIEDRTAGARWQPPAADSEKLLLTPEDVAQRLSVGRSTVYALMRAGELRSVRIGRLRRIPVGAVRAYVERIVEEEGDG